MAVETGIPHQFIADLDGRMLRTTLEYLKWRAAELEKARS